MFPVLVTDGRGVAIVVWSIEDALAETALVLADQLRTEAALLLVAETVATVERQTGLLGLC